MHKAVNLIILIIPLFIPGYLKNYFGWSVAFGAYGCTYFIIGTQLKTGEKQIKYYPFYILMTTLIIPINAVFDSFEYWYPYIMPAYLLIALLSFLAGIYYSGRNLKLFYLFLSSSVLFISISAGSIRNILFKSTINPKRESELLEIKPSLKFETFDNKLVAEQGFFKGKVVILDFWFLECRICREKLPTFLSLIKKFENRDDILLYSVIDGSINKKSEVLIYLDEAGLDKKYFLYDKDGLFSKRYKLASSGYPIELIINKKGFIKEIISGYTDADLYFKNSLNKYLFYINEK